MFCKTLFTVAALAIGAIAAPLQSRATNDVIPDKYMVYFKEGLSDNAIQTHKSKINGAVSQRIQTTGQRFDGIRINFDFNTKLRGYSGHFDKATIEEIRKNPDVAEVTPQHIYKIVDVPVRAKEMVTQDGAEWGLARISSKDTSDLTKYTYDSTAGEGATVYVVDTGVMIDHEDLEGRAKWGATFTDDKEDSDGNGHGSHCAGTVAGKTYGVAKKAQIVAVKVLDAQGSGSTESVVGGLNWVKENAGANSVVSMSLGGPSDAKLDEAVTALKAAGVTVVVAAGNESQDADNVSPARVTEIITVGATDNTDKIAEFSNFGKAVDVFAPGVDVTSIWNDGKTKTISGTSMACPHVAGLAAYYIGLEKAKGGLSAKADPDAIAEKLVSTGTDSVQGAPSDTTTTLINNGATGGNTTVAFNFRY